MAVKQAATILIRATRSILWRPVKVPAPSRAPESVPIKVSNDPASKHHNHFSYAYRAAFRAFTSYQRRIPNLIPFRSAIEQIKRRMLFAVPGGFPLTLGLLGISLVTTPTTSDKVINNIAILLKKTSNVDKTNEERQLFGRASLKDFELGRLLGYGCNAAVYEARPRSIDDQNSLLTTSSCSFTQIDEQTESDIDILSCRSSSDSSADEDQLNIEDRLNELTLKEVRHRAAKAINTNESDILPAGQFNFAIKMMFNYGIQSNSEALEKAMNKELLPLRKCGLHPNIVRMYSCFVDSFPILREAFDYYPMAIPTSLSSDGYGRNKTLFIVMRRYDVTLSEYIRLHKPNQQERLLLFAQLIEALLYLKQNSIVHRDLKSDNLLISNTTGELVLADFGCALYKPNSLRVPYVTDEISKGGNLALMAPEIVMCQPGPKSFLDYSKADLWASGTLAYEFFSMENPFYHGNYRQETYDDKQLPSLLPAAPPIFEQFVFALLRKNPKERPSLSLAADCLQIYILFKSKVFQMNKNELYQNYMWTALETFFHKSQLSLVEFNLKRLFFERQCSQSLYQAQSYLQRLSANI